MQTDSHCHFPSAPAELIDYKNHVIRLTLPNELGVSFDIQYSEDGADWEELGTHSAGTFVDNDSKRSNEPSGYYLISVLEKNANPQSGGNSKP